MLSAVLWVLVSMEIVGTSGESSNQNTSENRRKSGGFNPNGSVVFFETETAFFCKCLFGQGEDWGKSITKVFVEVTC